MKKTLTRLWTNSPMNKVLITALCAVIFLLTFSVLSKTSESTEQSSQQPVEQVDKTISENGKWDLSVSKIYSSNYWLYDIDLIKDSVGGREVISGISIEENSEFFDRKKIPYTIEILDTCFVLLHDLGIAIPMQSEESGSQSISQSNLGNFSDSTTQRVLYNYILSEERLYNHRIRETNYEYDPLLYYVLPISNLNDYLANSDTLEKKWMLYYIKAKKLGDDTIEMVYYSIPINPDKEYSKHTLLSIGLLVFSVIWLVSIHTKIQPSTLFTTFIIGTLLTILELLRIVLKKGFGTSLEYGFDVVIMDFMEYPNDYTVILYIWVLCVISLSFFGTIRAISYHQIQTIDHHKGNTETVESQPKETIHTKRNEIRSLSSTENIIKFITVCISLATQIIIISKAL